MGHQLFCSQTFFAATKQQIDLKGKKSRSDFNLIAQSAIEEPWFPYAS